MTKHPYLRAYMAGIVVPTFMLLIIVSIFTLARHFFNIPISLDRIVVFPMAVVPNLGDSGMSCIYC